MNQPNAVTDPRFRHKLLTRLLGAVAVAGLLGSPKAAQAQAADLAPPPPNILLLVDSSGSMDYKTGVNTFPTCKYSGVVDTSQTSERSRWIDLVEVLTGTIPDYECQTLERASTLFRTEYALSSADPYDFLYPNPYHRPVNLNCVVGPGTLDTNPALFPDAALKSHQLSSLASTCTFVQATDGIIDSFAKDVRFGLMTFDTEPRGDKTVAGLWSYYVGSPKQGKPQDCPTMQDQEVGSRNPSAPPWEGRAVGFGNATGTAAAQLARNEQIQKVLLASRPYGATPIAGMLNDARAYFFDDDSADPTDTSFDFGPHADLVAAPCRHNAIVLLSDGQPNMDLRPYCEPGGCPYEKAEDIAAYFKGRNIPIYVIGFALPTITINGSPRTCQSIVSDVDLNQGTGLCATNSDPGLQACCALNRIAQAGGPTPPTQTQASLGLDDDWTHAHFADSRVALRYELSRAIGANFSISSRTPSVQASGTGYVNAGADLDFARGFRFAAAFAPGKVGQGWVGSLNRSRYVCSDDDGVKVPQLLTPSEADGDYFVSNVNKSGPSARVLYTVLSSANQTHTLRPNLPTGENEGAGTETGTLSDYTSAAFAAAPTPTQMQLAADQCLEGGVNITPDACRDRILKWLVGLDNGTVNKRCDGGDCSLVADFFHSTPRAVAGRPNALLSDNSYDQFILDQTTAKRPSVLYASSNDGFLHAFKMGPVGQPDESEEMSTRTLETNELWAFMPPAVVATVKDTYPGTHQLLLDGSPAVKDVVATPAPLATNYKFLLQRSKADAQAGGGTWRTILVQSFGQNRPGYFAIDVTDPVPDDDKGPQFLWQLVTDETGAQIFGTGGGTPLITTVFLDGDEVAVAVLPGGYGAAHDDVGTCTRPTDVSTFASGYRPRTTVPCYNAPSAKLARSLTIVRLDSGKILRSFRRDDDEVPKLKANAVVTEAKLDSPLTGQPVPFPSEVGAVADRIFIGDQDGALWRVTLAGPPADWKMDLFFDTFPGDGTFGHAWDAGQPIVTPPILSVDDLGHLTVAVSTGDQEALAGNTAMVNYVWSLVEKPNADRSQFDTVPQWHLDFKGPDAGFRVIGTMALFARTLYFAAMNRPSGACSQGVGRVYAMDYLRPHVSGTPGRGGFVDQKFVQSPTADYLTTAILTGSSAEAFLGGVSIGQQPTCENGSISGDDAYFALGAHNSLGTPTTGKFQLFVSTGNTPTNPTAPGITKVDQGGAQAAAIDLDSPTVVTRIDSWAAIVE